MSLRAKNFVSEGRQYTYRLLLGAPDEKKRRWLREAEAIGIVQKASKGYTPTFFNKEGVWRSSRGYFRLFEHKDGSKGLLFGFHYHNLEIEEVPDASFPEGKRNALKNYRDVYQVTSWPVDIQPKLADIDNAIDVYTSNMGKAITEESILYETDPAKGIFRAGGAAYMLRLISDNFVGEISYYTKILGSGLVNPFGENILERFLVNFDSGIGLFAIRERHYIEQQFGHAEWQRRQKKIKRLGERYPYARNRSESERILFVDYFQKSLRYLRNQDPTSAEEKKMDWRYYTTKRGIHILGAFLKQGKYYFRKISLDNAAAGRNVSANLVNALRGYIVGGFLLVLLPLVMAGLSFLGLLTPRIDREILIDLKDPLVQKLSWPARRIKAFATLERPVRREAFREVSMLSRPTFSQPPRGIKRAASFDVWPSDLLETSLQERGRSVVRFYFDKNAQPSATPDKDVRAIKILRTDGIIAVKFLNEEIVWGYYTGTPLDPVTPPPPDALLAYLKKGHILQIDNRADAKQRETYITFNDAENFFERQFGRPLIEAGIHRPKHIEPSPIQTAGLEALQTAYRQTAEELSVVRTMIGNAQSLAANNRRSQHDKLIKRLIRKNPNLANDRCGLFRPFAETIAKTISALEEHGVSYDFYNVGKGKDHSFQLVCNKFTVLTKDGQNIAVVENGVLTPEIDTPDKLFDYASAGMKDMPPHRTGLKKLFAPLHIFPRP